MKVVFISGKFRDTTHWKIEQNIRKAEELALTVWKEGMVAICPHMNTWHFQGEEEDKVWLDGDLEILSRCDAVLTVDNWRDSEGAKVEIEKAHELQIPVFHYLFDLLFWIDNLERYESMR